MSFSSYDFSETILGTGIERESIKRAVAAWGNDYGGNEGSQWEGGFLLEMKGGQFVYVTGWCDYTGWGCQDGTEIFKFDALPDLAALKKGTPDWETTLPDLQKFIETGEGLWD